MGENAKNEQTQKKSWFDGLKVEFGKIVWPDKKSLGRQTVAVAAVSIILGLIISVLDFIIKYGVEFLVNI